MRQNSVSFSCQSKQVWRCCINFSQELTCQVLTNQHINIGRGAWPMCELGEKSQKQLAYNIYIYIYIEYYTKKHLKINNFYSRRHVLRVKCVRKSWVTNKTLQIWALSFKPPSPCLLFCKMNSRQEYRSKLSFYKQ